MLRRPVIPAAIALAVAASLAAPAAAQPEDVVEAPRHDHNDPAAASFGALDKKIAVLNIDALGMDAERVARLDALFRMELERLAGKKLPTQREIDAVVQRSRRLRRCQGEDRCLAAIGKRLGVEAVVSGSVAALGDSFIVNIKVVDTESGKQLRRIATDPLRGRPDELIEAVRVAAYKLLAPDQLLGAVAVLTDLVGARVSIDGEVVGMTPLSKPIARLSLGDHALRVEAEGYVPFEETIRVRFQKTTRVVVRLVTREAAENGEIEVVTGPPRIVKRPAKKPWYTNKWTYIGAGVAAVILGGAIGYAVANDSAIDCSNNPERCLGN